MNTASIQFLEFAALAACIYNLWGSIAWRQTVLLCANIFFLLTFSANPISLLPFAAFLIIGFAGVQLVQAGISGKYFAALVVLMIGAFAWLKKYAIFPAASFLKISYVTIGFSYILFRVLHLMIDARGSSLPKKIGFLSYLNYTLNFMTLVSGPIQRYEQFEETQLAMRRPPLTAITAGEGLHRIVLGFFKVSVLSWFLSNVQKEMLETLAQDQSLPQRVLGGAGIAVLYALYLFFNFSGYTDIVIGVGRFFRFRLPENFDRPFSCSNYMSFWSRWHITLSDWLKSYVYNPLLLASVRRWPSPQAEPFLVAGALFITFSIIGIWHGRTSEFLMFGLLQGFGIALNRFYQVLMAKKLGRERYRALASNPVYKTMCRGLTFTYFAFTLFWFWSTWKQIRDIAQTLHVVGILGAVLITFGSATVILALVELVRDRVLSIKLNDSPILLSRYSLTVFDTSLAVCALSMGMLLKAPPPEIVYKAF